MFSSNISVSFKFVNEDFKRSISRYIVFLFLIRTSEGIADDLTAGSFGKLLL